MTSGSYSSTTELVKILPKQRRAISLWEDGRQEETCGRCVWVRFANSTLYDSNHFSHNQKARAIANPGWKLNRVASALSHDRRDRVTVYQP